MRGDTIPSPGERQSAEFSQPPSELGISRIGFLLYDVYLRWQAQFDALVEPLADLSQTQWWLIVNLTRKPEVGLSQIGLARSLNVSKVAVSKLIDQLEAKGLLRRVPDIEDRRRNRVQLTAKGRKLARQMADVSDQMNEKIGRGLPLQRYPELWELLSMMQNNLKQMGPLESA